MKRVALPLTALLAVAGLVVAIVVIAASSADGTPVGSVLDTPPTLTGTAPSFDALPPCSLPSGTGASAIELIGVCTGNLAGAFTCVEADETLLLSNRQPVDRRDSLYVTIVVADFAGPGTYPDAATFAQLSGPANTPRWSNRDVWVKVAGNGSVRLAPTTLAPEPGTPASGLLSLEGRATCLDGEPGEGAG